MGVVRSGNKSILVPCFSFWISFFLLLCFVEFEKWCFEEGGGKVMISTFYITVILTSLHSLRNIVRLLRRLFLAATLCPDQGHLAWRNAEDATAAPGPSRYTMH